MRNKELDAKVAEKVFGRQYRYADLPWFTSSADFDYQVLHHVRDTWDGQSRSLFRTKLHTIWIERGDSWRSDGKGGYELYAVPGAMYEPGDYSIAALKALELFETASSSLRETFQNCTKDGPGPQSITLESQRDALTSKPSDSESVEASGQINKEHP